MAVQTFSDLTPADTDENDGGTLYVLGRRFTSEVAGEVTGVRWRVPDTLSGAQHYILLYDSDFTGDLDYLASRAVAPTPGGYEDLAFTAPVAIDADHEYVVCVLTNHYVFTTGLSFPEVSGDLASAGFSLVATDPDDARYPSTPSSAHFHLGPIVDTGGGPTVVPVDGVDEDEAATAPGRRKARMVTGLVEDETATASGRRKLRAVTSSVEVEQAGAPARRKTRTVASLAEIEQALSPRRVKRLRVPTAIEVESLAPVGRAKRRGVPSVSEVEHAVAPTIPGVDYEPGVLVAGGTSPTLTASGTSSTLVASGRP